MVVMAGMGVSGPGCWRKLERQMTRTIKRPHFNFKTVTQMKLTAISIHHSKNSKNLKSNC